MLAVGSQNRWYLGIITLEIQGASDSEEGHPSRDDSSSS